LIIPGPMDKELDPDEVFHRCLSILKAQNVFALATALDSKPRVRAMEYAVNDAGIIFMLTEGGRKVRDILLNMHVSLAVWTQGGESGGLKGLTITARAEVVDPGDKKRFAEYYDSYRRHIGRQTPSPELLPKTVKLIRAVPDMMELFDPALAADGYSAKQLWRR
jgi:uncharacterized pyridoxamine 5'-phosphate oxidase family protein